MPALLQAVPDAKVLVLSMQDDPRYVREAFDAGASGYVLKEAADNEVVGAIRAVAAGERYVHPSLGAKLFAADSEQRRRAEQDPLSEREREVLHLLALGHTNQEIAKSCSSRFARPRPTGRTSCRSSIWGAGRSSCATRSPKGCSTRSRIRAEHLTASAPPARHSLRGGRPWSSLIRAAGCHFGVRSRAGRLEARALS